MSFLDRISEANDGFEQPYIPFSVAGEVLGRVVPETKERLCEFDAVFEFKNAGLRLCGELDDPQCNPAKRTEAVAEVTHALRAQGQLHGWRDELFAVRRRFFDPPQFKIERAALPLLGVRGWGVHINGYTSKDGAKNMWIGRRSKSKPTWPGLLDQLVAGGQPADLSVAENVIKECQEEAGIAPELAAEAVSTGAITYLHATPQGLRPDVVFTFDLDLPQDFIPCNQDGEVQDFELWPMHQVVETVRESSAFKFNCSLVVIDFLLRHGVITPEEPDYLELVQGLRQDALSR